MTDRDVRPTGDPAPDTAAAAAGADPAAIAARFARLYGVERLDADAVRLAEQMADDADAA